MSLVLALKSPMALKGRSSILALVLSTMLADLSQACLQTAIEVVKVFDVVSAVCFAATLRCFARVVASVYMFIQTSFVPVLLVV